MAVFKPAKKPPTSKVKREEDVCRADAEGSESVEFGLEVEVPGYVPPLRKRTRRVRIRIRIRNRRRWTPNLNFPEGEEWDC